MDRLGLWFPPGSDEGGLVKGVMPITRRFTVRPIFGSERIYRNGVSTSPEANLPCSDSGPQHRLER